MRWLWARLGSTAEALARCLHGKAFGPIWQDRLTLGGVDLSFLVLFLIVTGLPWAAFWGGWIRGGAELIGEGYPPVYRRYAAVDAPTVGSDFNDVPWTLQQAPLPQVSLDTPHGHHAPPAAQSGTPRAWTPDWHCSSRR